MVDRLLVLGSRLQRELDQLFKLAPIEKDSLALWAVVDVDPLAIHDHHDFGTLWTEDVH